MLERLRMQEVSQIIFSVPEGAIIAGTGLQVNEPVMIIEKPAMSQLSFKTRAQKSEDGRGFISASGQTQSIDFTINEGTVLYSVWSYLHGINENNTMAKLRGTEWLNRKDKYLKLTTESEPMDIVLYAATENGLELLKIDIDYIVFFNTTDNKYYIELLNDYEKHDKYYINYSYVMSNVKQTIVKQIHNNIFCSMDIFFDAVDCDTDEKHTVCVHCDKVQVFMDLSIGINNSTKASFTPIQVRSIPQGTELNKNIASIMVI